jgi:hypothetical protein
VVYQGWKAWRFLIKEMKVSLLKQVCNNERSEGD